MTDPYSILDWLSDRADLVPWADPSRLKRLGGSGETGYRTDTQLTLDRGRMRISGICTSERLDRSREIVRSKGLDVSDHKLNPILTIGHKWREADGVIGRCEVNGTYTVEPGREKGSTPFVGQFFQTGPNAERAMQAFELVDSGVLRGVSVGFLIPPGGTQKITADDGYPALDIVKSKLFEVTVLPVGDNPDAVVRVVEKGLGGRRLLPEFDSLLRPYVPPKRVCVRGGFKREKNMNGYGMNGMSHQQQPGMNPPAADPNIGMGAPPVPPSAQFLSDLNTYLIGMLKFLKEQGGVQESPSVKMVIPQIQLPLSQAFRAIQNTYAQVLTEHPDIPTLPGGGSLLAAEPVMDPMGDTLPMDGTPNSAVVDAPLEGDAEAVETPTEDMPVEGEGDMGDEGMPDMDALDFGDDVDEDDFEFDEEEDEAELASKGLHGKRAAMTRRSQRIIDAFWESFERDLSQTDAMRMKRLAELADKVGDYSNEKDRREIVRHAAALREKALHPTPKSLREKKLSEATESENAELLAELEKLMSKMESYETELYQLTGKGD